MKNTIVYITDPKVASGGYADRITGMALLFRISQSFNCNFKIHFKHPFDFFKIFPKKKNEYEFDQNLINTSNSNIKFFNLIDDNFNNGIDQLCKSLIQENGIIALVLINNIKSFIFDPLFNRFIAISHNQLDADDIERSILYDFSNKFLDYNLDYFNSNLINLIPKFKQNTIGIQIRLGGSNLYWTDPNFKIPDIDSIILKLNELEDSFTQIFLCSDNIDYKNKIFKVLNDKWITIVLEETPLHLERSSHEHSNFVTRVLGDHLLLTECSVGVIICGGGYGRTAAIISQKPYFRV